MSSVKLVFILFSLFAGPLSLANDSDLAVRLGQLFIANVDGVESKTPVHPVYKRIIRELHIGGVIVHTLGGPHSPSAYLADFAEMQKSAQFPLIVSADHIDVPKKSASRPGEIESVQVGLGFDIQSDRNWRTGTCYKDKVYLENLIFKLHGLNTMLGPIIEHVYMSQDEINQMDVTITDVVTDASHAIGAIDTMRGMNVVPTIKHFPYTPRTFDLHKENYDTKFSPAEVQKMIEIFKVGKSRPTFIMTTHVFNSQIDPEDVVTFSEKWIGMLKSLVHPESLIMTDALFMLSDTSVDKIFEKTWPHDQFKTSDREVQYAVRAIIAGHDLILMEGTSADSRRILKGTLEVAQSNTAIGKSYFRESTNPISEW